MQGNTLWRRQLLEYYKNILYTGHDTPEDFLENENTFSFRLKIITLESQSQSLIDVEAKFTLFIFILAFVELSEHRQTDTQTLIAF